MAYFRCALGGGSGNGAVITVTYTAEFYNQTLTATNGVDTVSVVATSSGTADITVPSEGSWTVSCTISGDTYTSDAVVVDLSYATTLTAIPDGSTVTPTDDIQTWLKCAGITDKSYTLLSEVLADTDTYINLLADSNACDYMARSTTWASTIVADADAMRLLGMYDYACNALLGDSTWASAIANSTYVRYVIDGRGLVPIMTSNTTPSGECFGTTATANNPLWKAFDGDDSTYSELANSSTVEQFIGYKFAEPKTIRYFDLLSYHITGAAGTMTVKLYGSNDNSTWDTLYTKSSVSVPASGNVTISDVIENDTAYLYYRLGENPSQSSKLRIKTLQFYGDENTAQTDIIHSAPSDTIYYMDNGTPTTLCVTDANGVGTVDWSDLPTGDITLYSSVAKDPDDLTDDYGKSIKVTKNKTEAWLMPDLGVLYWWGYEDANLQDLSSANGWSMSSAQFVAPTHNTNNISIVNATNKVSGVGTKSSVSGTQAYAIAKKNSTSGGYLGYETSKAISYGHTTVISNTAIGLKTLSISSNVNIYVTTDTNSVNVDLSALWYE